MIAYRYDETIVLMNEISPPIQKSLKAVVNYLNCRFRQNREDELYRSVLAEYIAVIASRRVVENPVSYVEETQKIRGTYKEDKRSASDIVKDTFSSMGITVVEE